MELPSYKNHGFVLDDGEMLNREFPESFFIPSLEARNVCAANDCVKLIFRMEETEGSDELSVERMWVQVETKHVLDGRVYYQGILDSDPVGSDCISAGAKVTFQPCHIIDIYE